MRFDAKAYDKLYPRQPKQASVETAVDGFTPSVKEVEDEKVVETTTAVESEVENGGDGADSSGSE